MISKILNTFKKNKYELASFRRKITKSKYQYRVSPMDSATIFGHSFSPKANHFLIQFLIEESQGHMGKNRKSAVERFHNKFCPSTTGQALGLNLENDLPLFVYPWGVFGSGAKVTNKNPELSRFCGPSTLKFVNEEKHRMRQLTANLEKGGYKPDQFPNSYIQGVWLTSVSGRQKFVVLQGNHRMAALSFLGYNSIDVRTDLFVVREVRESEILNWPLVEAGLIDEREALLIFQKFF